MQAQFTRWLGNGDMISMIWNKQWGSISGQTLKPLSHITSSSKYGGTLVGLDTMLTLSFV